MPYSERDEPEQLCNGRYRHNEYHDDRTQQSRSYDELVYAAPLLEYGQVCAAVVDVYYGRKPHDEECHRLRNGKAGLYAAA